MVFERFKKMIPGLIKPGVAETEKQDSRQEIEESKLQWQHTLPLNSLNLLFKNALKKGVNHSEKFYTIKLPREAKTYKIRLVEMEKYKQLIKTYPKAEVVLGKIVFSPGYMSFIGLDIFLSELREGITDVLDDDKVSESTSGTVAVRERRILRETNTLQVVDSESDDGESDVLDYGEKFLVRLEAMEAEREKKEDFPLKEVQANDFVVGSNLDKLARQTEFDDELETTHPIDLEEELNHRLDRSINQWRSPKFNKHMINRVFNNARKNGIKKGSIDYEGFDPKDLLDFTRYVIRPTEMEEYLFLCKINSEGKSIDPTTGKLVENSEILNDEELQEFFTNLKLGIPITPSERIQYLLNKSS